MLFGTRMATRWHSAHLYKKDSIQVHYLLVKGQIILTTSDLVVKYDTDYVVLATTLFWPFPLKTLHDMRINVLYQL